MVFVIGASGFGNAVHVKVCDRTLSENRTCDRGDVRRDRRRRESHVHADAGILGVSEINSRDLKTV